MAAGILTRLLTGACEVCCQDTKSRPEVEAIGCMGISPAPSEAEISLSDTPPRAEERSTRLPPKRGSATDPPLTFVITVNRGAEFHFNNEFRTLCCSRKVDFTETPTEIPQINPIGCIAPTLILCDRSAEEKSWSSTIRTA